MRPKLISIVIPVYNEEKYIEEVVKRVLKAKTLRLKKQIVIVDDASSDNTPKILEALEKKYKRKNVKVFYTEINQGKGAALKRGFMYTSGDIVIVQDADLEYNPEEYERLLVCVSSNILRTVKTIKKEVVIKGITLLLFLSIAV